MAPRVKHWLGLMALGLAVVAIWRLPPTAFEPREQIEITHEEARFRALSDELRLADATLKRIRWADSLSTLVVEGGAGQVVFAIPEGTDLTVEEIEAAKARVSLEGSGLAGRQPNMALGFIYQPTTHGAVEGVRGEWRARSETYVGTKNRTDFCFRLRVTQPERIARAVRYDARVSQPGLSTDLGPCLIYAQYGMPGRDIARWLESGGIQFGLSNADRPVISGPQYRRTGLFGATYMSTRGGLVDDQCFAGIEEACRTLFLEPVRADPMLASDVEISQASPAISTWDRWQFAGESGFLLADLEREFGPERFARFWTSEAPVAEAFHDAFGIEAGAWVVTWMASSFSIDAPGPQLAQSTSSTAVITLGFFVLVGFLRNRKRTVA